MRLPVGGLVSCAEEQLKTATQTTMYSISAIKKKNPILCERHLCPEAKHVYYFPAYIHVRVRQGNVAESEASLYLQTANQTANLIVFFFKNRYCKFQSVPVVFGFQHWVHHFIAAALGFHFCDSVLV